MLGHLRHEIGHYYWTVLVDDAGAVEGFRARVRRRAGVLRTTRSTRHYADGPPAGWEERYVSAYATMHPWEDFAETFAHVLHIRDALETAHQTGLSVDPQLATRDFGDVVVGTWVPLSAALNQMNRSLGHGDLYPFVLAPAVVEKMVWVDALLR